MDGFIKVVPTDYKHMLAHIDTFEKEGLSEQEAAMKAFTLVTSPKKQPVAKS